MYATKQIREQNGKYYFHNIFNDMKSTLMCASPGEKIYQIEIREAVTGEKTPYYAWKRQNGKIELIFPSKVQVEVCFPYGIKVASLNSGGHLINVCIREKNEKMNFCNDITSEEKKIISELFSEIDKRHTSIRSLLRNAYDTSSIGVLDTTSATVDVGTFSVKIAHKDKKESIQLITINNEVECYYIGFEGRHWFFKDLEKYYSAIKIIIYGKGKVAPDNAI